MHALMRDPVTGRFRRRYSCSSCQMLRGMDCLHENGCPDSWIDTTRECRNCGCDNTGIPGGSTIDADDACAACVALADSVLRPALAGGPTFAESQSFCGGSLMGVTKPRTRLMVA